MQKLRLMEKQPNLLVLRPLFPSTPKLPSFPLATPALEKGLSSSLPEKGSRLQASGSRRGSGTLASAPGPGLSQLTQRPPALPYAWALSPSP